MEKTMFRIETRKSKGNLHLRLEGVFNGGSALTLTTALREQHLQCNRLFIDTDKLHQLEPLGMDVFHSFLRQFPAVSERIYFKGRNGARLALDGHRVLRVKERHGCGCSGKCTVCKCAERKKQQLAAQADEVV